MGNAEIAATIDTMKPADRGLLREVMRRKETRGIFLDLIRDEFEEANGRRPRGFLEIIRWIRDHWEEILPVILFIIGLFGEEATP